MKEFEQQKFGSNMEPCQSSTSQIDIGPNSSFSFEKKEAPIITLRSFHGSGSGRMTSKMRWNTYRKDHCGNGTSGNRKMDLLDYEVISWNAMQQDGYPRHSFRWTLRVMGKCNLHHSHLTVVPRHQSLGLLSCVSIKSASGSDTSCLDVRNICLSKVRVVNQWATRAELKARQVRILGVIPTDLLYRAHSVFSSYKNAHLTIWDLLISKKNRWADHV